MTRFCWHFTILLIIIGSYGLSGQQPPQCSNGCLINIKGLLSEYKAGVQSELTLQNTSKQKLNVNVGIEGFEGGSWYEVAGSISDPKNSFTKMLKLKPLEAGGSVVLSFDPCATTIMIRREDGPHVVEHPCTPAQSSGAPARFRLRVDVFDAHGQKAQVINSQEFKLE